MDPSDAASPATGSTAVPWREVFLACAVAIGLLGYRLGDAWITSGFVDPISRAGAQDEAVYGQAAMRMAAGGGWLTPMYLDRPLLNKPPLLHWAGAISVWLFGVSTFALRLAPLAAGLAVCLITFRWVRSVQSATAAFAAMLLLAANPTFFFFSRRFLPDTLLVVWVTLGLYLFSRDPKLERSVSIFGVGISCGLAVMTKSVAGLFLLAVIVLFWITAGRGSRPSLKAVAGMGLGTVAIAGPWHVYQFMVHRDWFLAEYVGAQIIQTGSTIPLGSALWSQTSFFITRFAATDPLLLTFAAIGIASTAGKLFRRTTDEDQRLPSLLLCWATATALSLLVFRHQSMHYFLPAAPALAMLGAIDNPLFRARRGGIGLALIVAVVLLKGLTPDTPLSLDYRRCSTVAAAPALKRYCQMKRGNELINVMAEDEFYATALGLPFVRYVVLEQSLDPTKVPPFMRDLGIVMPATQFLDRREGKYAQILPEWGAVSSRPIGTVIILRSPDELSVLVQGMPGADFFLSDSLRSGLSDAVLSDHMVQSAGERHS